jgi:hypothetical protein
MSNRAFAGVSSCQDEAGNASDNIISIPRREVV